MKLALERIFVNLQSFASSNYTSLAASPALAPPSSVSRLMAPLSEVQVDEDG
jgi:hypothetical protein